MLQSIRKNIQGTMAKIIVGLIIVPFALFGIESLVGGGGARYVAEVNGEGITAPELQQQINQQKRRLLMSMGENIDPSMLDDQLLAGPTLEFMIQKKLFLQAAGEYQMAVSDAALGNIIGAIEAFQIEGKFNSERYRQVLSDQGYSLGSFQDSLRDDLLMTQLRAGLSGSEFVTKQEFNQMAVVNEEQRDLRYLVMPLDDFRSEADLSEAEIEAWYEQNQQSFKTTESVVLEYVELSAVDFYPEVAEDEVRELFELERDAFQLPEERAISHILFEQGEDESDGELQARIEKVVAELAQAEKSFAELARIYSQDLGSANFGGELGLTSGDSFPAEIEAAVAALAVDEVSAPVPSDAGWHLLKVTEIRAGKVVDFAEVRAELELRLQQEGGQRELVKAVEELRDLVFNAEDLAEPAASLELELHTGTEISRNQQQGLFADPRLISAAFSKEVVEDGYNSDVIELDEAHYVVLRVSEHKPPSVKPLREVRGEMLAVMTEELAKERITERAEALLASLHAGASIEELALANDYPWQVELGAKRDNRNVPASMLARVFTLPVPVDSDSLFDYVQTAGGDIEIFELVRVMAGNSDTLAPARRQQLSGRLLQEGSSAVDAHYQKALLARADIERS
ncbi:MAG: SurA N-terminal domain-containing protein [Gammaproteobacteria bacterium]|nr:SurA N-terminal domain-containing protein [Gammaproteobacteria bacterium]